MEIILVRHGRPTCPAGGFLSAEQFVDWIRRYDLAPVVGLSPQAAELAATAAWVFCSPLERSRSSARLIAPQQRIIEDAIFREADLSVPAVADWMRLPVAIWLALARARWLRGFGAAAENRRAAAARAARAARLLEQAAQRDGRTLLVGHGWFNRMIAARLRASGWVETPSSSSGYWGARRFALRT